MHEKIAFISLQNGDCVIKLVYQFLCILFDLLNLFDIAVK